MVQYRLIEVEAVSLSECRRPIRFSYAYRYGLLARMAMKGYFATLGRGKCRFSIVNTDRRGDPVYARATRGAIERNAVRYCCAIQAYMDTLAILEEERFERRISRWCDLTDRHRLFEMSKQEYLTYKKRERRDQVMLQRGLGRNHASAVLRSLPRLIAKRKSRALTQQLVECKKHGGSFFPPILVMTSIPLSSIIDNHRTDS